MSLRTLLIWCIIAGLLGGGAVLVREGVASPGRVEESSWGSLRFDPASVTELRIERGEERAYISRDGAAIDQWLGRWEGVEASRGWGVEATRVRGALRALATARVRLSDTELVRDVGTRVEVVSGSGTTVLLIGSARSGGRAPVRIEQRDGSGVVERVLDGWIVSGVADALTPAATLGWRSERLVEMAPSMVTAVRVEAGSYATAFERSGGRWWITDPVRVAADREKCERFVREVLGLKASGFVDQAVDAATSGLDRPIATIELQVGDGGYRLLVGQHADIGGETLYASLEGDGGSTTVRVATDALSALTAVPDAYVSTVAGVFGVTDARRVRVLGRDGTARLTADRSGGAWFIGSERADTLTGEAIDRLVRLLSRLPADGVRLLEDSSELPRVIGEVELGDVDGGALGRYRFALQDGGGGMRLLVIRSVGSGRLAVWSYSGEEAQATGAWLAVAASRAATPG